MKTFRQFHEDGVATGGAMATTTTSGGQSPIEKQIKKKAPASLGARQGRVREVMPEETQIDEMGGDQHYSDTKGATSGGGNATPITRKKMVDDAAKTLRRVTDTANMAPAPAQNFMTKEDVSEAVKSGNLTYGYHGTINASDDADRSKKYAAAHSQAKRLLTAHGHLQDARQPNVMVKHFLDSPHGRHIADIHNDKARPDAANKEILSRFGHFKKKYDPKDFKEETEFAEDTVAAQKEIVKANASTHPNPTGFAKDSKKRFLQIGNQLLNKQKEK